MEKNRLSYFYATLAIFFWSTIPTAFKAGLAELPVIPMLTIAVVVSSIILFIIIVAGKKIALIRQNSPKEILSSAILGFINPFIYYIILLKAYQLLPGQVAQPLNMIWPIILVFLSVPILKQKIEKKSFLALFISFAGVYIISSQGKLLNPGDVNFEGVLLATGSSVFWALYFILNVKDRRDEAVKLFLNFFFATGYLLIYLLLSGRWPEEISLKGVLASAYVGLFEMGITFFLWLKALTMAKTTDKISNLVYLAPFISLLFLHFFIHEPVFYTTPAGLLLIISGILIQNRKQRAR